MIQTDFLVIGSGIAGLSFAIKAADLLPEAGIVVVSKGKFSDSATILAQGGIAAVTDLMNDSLQSHIEDTLTAGDGHCDRTAVESIIREAPLQIDRLIKLGVRFDQQKDGTFHLAREAGHAAHRVLHFADTTGAEIHRGLTSAAETRKNIRFLEHHLVTDLICENNRCIGVQVLNKTGALYSISAGTTVIACGGIGQVYKYTTNPGIATGDGIAMAWRAGAEITDMEFVQFHPTALWEENPDPAFLISEAVRGAGARLINSDGERFMKRYDPRMELATRDIVSRAIRSELSATAADYVCLDCRFIDRRKFLQHFPAIYEKLCKKGIDPLKDLIPVVPAAHYSCGGIITDNWGKSSVDHLYVCGESARTGLHGANRLASNSLLEAVVIANRAASHAAENQSEPCQIVSFQNENRQSLAPPDLTWIADNKDSLRRLMDTVAITATGEEIENALAMALKLQAEIGLKEKKHGTTFYFAELKNMTDTACLILTAAAQRSTNIGVFSKNQINQIQQTIHL